jgi:hypothetical protein
LGTRTISFPVRDWKSYVVLDILVEDSPFSVELARFPLSDRISSALHLRWHSSEQTAQCDFRNSIVQLLLADVFGNWFWPIRGN